MQGKNRPIPKMGGEIRLGGPARRGPGAGVAGMAAGAAGAVTQCGDGDASIEKAGAEGGEALARGFVAVA